MNNQSLTTQAERQPGQNLNNSAETPQPAVRSSAWLGDVAEKLQKQLNISQDVIKNSLITIARRLQRGESEDMGGILQNNIVTFLRLNNPETLETLGRLPTSNLCRQP